MSGLSRRIKRNRAADERQSGFKARAMLRRFCRLELPNVATKSGPIAAESLMCQLERKMLRRKPTAKRRGSRGGGVTLP